uniref:Calpain-2 catalytic subunit n=1 Tax=Taeniopygia guttata TaxID=59729 RepID=A0A674GTK6_TAEGU
MLLHGAASWRGRAGEAAPTATAGQSHSSQAGGAAGLSSGWRRAEGRDDRQHGRAVPCLGQRSGALLQECLQEERLFQDRSFPAGPTTLGCRELGPRSHKTQGIVWRTPTVGRRGKGGIPGRAAGCPCWLLAAIAFLTLNEEILARVVPKDQSFQDKYTGIFHFQFWQCREWVDVVVDNRLPTKNGELLLVPLAEGSEFWSTLLEKAHANLNGSYESLSGGTTTKGFEDFTSGIAGWYELHKPPPNLFKIIQKALQKGSLLGCSTDCGAESLVTLHTLLIPSGELPRNSSDHIRVSPFPWAVRFSSSCPNSSGVDPEVQERLTRRHEDGGFWGVMVFSDFLRHYSCLDICNLTPGTLASERYKKWSLQKLDGNWRRGATAGVCRNYPNTFWMNPQYLIKLEEEDEDHDDPEGGCTFPIGLIQEHCRKQKRMGEDMHTIGFMIYEARTAGRNFSGQTNIHLSKNFFLTNKVLNRFEDFCLRVFSEKNEQMDGSTKSFRSMLQSSLSNMQAAFQNASLLPEAKPHYAFLSRFHFGFCVLQKIYREIDVDRLGTMNSYEMRRALETAGLKLNCQLHQIIVARFADEDLVIDLDNFVCCLIRLKTLFKVFRKLDTEKSGTIELNLLKFI